MFFLMLFSVSLVSAIEPMNLRTIEEIKSVNPSDVANLGFGVYQVSAQYNLGSYHEGEWMGFENKKCDDLKFGAVWVEFSWERPETDVILIDGAGNERKIYLPASTPAGDSTYGEYYWIAEDGSSYYANSNHGHGWPDLTYEQALTSEYLARSSLLPEQKNPDGEEPLKCGVIDEDSIKIKGQLVDQMTNEPIKGAQLSSAYEFSPAEVSTDSNGNFEFIVTDGLEWSGSFYTNCYGWSGNIGLQPNYDEFQYALRLGKFDAPETEREVSGQSEIDVEKIYAWPSADISIKSDIDASFNVMYKYKSREGYNGGGNSNYRKEHYSTAALPLDYDVFIQFEDEAGNTYDSSTFHTPAGAKCGIINLKYFNGESDWSVLFEVEPTETSGPIEIEIPEVVEQENPEVVSRLCLGCFKDNLCYPLGYRKGNEYCSESKTFISQLGSDSTCDNNFECSSNVCVSGKCIDEGFIQKIINWFKKLFG
tara:strand:- start:174 stop:1610 length:1437 start_codon:yes stop_codon:yes gene_type:complete